LGAVNNSSINNAAYRNELKWALTSSLQTGLSITENTASTNGAGSQNLVKIETLANSTANPVSVRSRGTEVFKVAYNSNKILGVSTSSQPTYSFIDNANAGMGYSSSQLTLHGNINAEGPDIFFGGDINLNINADGGYIEFYTNSSRLLRIDSDLYAFNGGMSYVSSVRVDSAGTETILADANGNLGSGTIQVATGTITYALPSSPIIGSTITIVVDTTSTVTIDPPGTTQRVRIGPSISTANTGTITSTTQGSTVTLVYVSADLWIATHYTGVWVLT